MKLNPAIEKLKRMCGEKGPNDPEEFDIMNLVFIINYESYLIKQARKPREDI